jgi:tRNA-2-methylthio-N6-dimethylallyladenosine synthase
MKYFIQTYGCQMNVADSDSMAGHFAGIGMERASDVASADIIFVNTCSVRQQAEQRALSFVGRLEPFKRSNSRLKVVVVGCMAQREGQRLRKQLPIIDLVIGAKDIERFPEIIAAFLSQGTEEEPLRQEPGDSRSRGLTGGTSDQANAHGRISAFVTIMRGCENFCSYCIVPYVRGPEKCRPAGDIIADINAKVRGGARDITLLGQNVNSYHSEGTDFSELLKLVNNIRGLDRIRFMTNHPKDLNDRLIDTVASLDKVCEHLHLPLQSGSDRVLASMNRRYTSADYRRIVDKLRKQIPGAALTTDIMVGFPGETDDDFSATLDLLRAVEFDFLFAFKYSPRPGTAAASRIDNVPLALKEQRHSRILEILRGISTQKNAKLVNTLQEVLVEGARDGQFEGRTRTNKKVFFSGDASSVGHLIDVRITGIKLNSLTGIPAERPSADYA